MVPHDDSLQQGIEPSVTFNVKSIELNYMIIPEKDNLESYIAVPVWDFIADMDYDEEYMTQEDTILVGREEISIVTINAIDGTIINREQGY